MPEFSWWGSEVEKGKPVPDGFIYSSETNDDWLTVQQLEKMIEDRME